MGGAIYVKQSFDDKSLLTVTNSQFNNNYVEQSGGAIAIDEYNKGHTLIVSKCTFTNNKAKGWTGGIHIEDSLLKLIILFLLKILDLMLELFGLIKVVNLLYLSQLLLII